MDIDVISGQFYVTIDWSSIDYQSIPINQLVSIDIDWSISFPMVDFIDYVWRTVSLGHFSREQQGETSMSDFCREQLAFAVTDVGHCTYAYACIVRVNQPLLVRCFILAIPGFSIPAFNFRHSSVPAFWLLVTPISFFLMKLFA